MQNGSVDALITVNRDISKAHRLFETACQPITQHAFLCQQIECLTHGVGRLNFHAGNKMRTNVCRDLHRTMEVERNNILKINVSGQCCRIGWTFCFYVKQTAPQLFQLLLDYSPIHAIRLSASSLVRYGMKSACSNRCRLINSPYKISLPSTLLP